MKANTWAAIYLVKFLTCVCPDRQVTERLLTSENYCLRWGACEALVATWPDPATRDLVAHHAVQDDDSDVRRAAVRALVEKWPDPATRDLLAQRAVQDDNAEVRGAACSALGKTHSEFGRILPTRDLDGVGPYLDPLEPIPREQIMKAAARVGIRPEDIDTQVASLSAHLGWDVTVGAGKKAVKKPGQSKPGRKRRS